MKTEKKYLILAAAVIVLIIAIALRIQNPYIQQEVEHLTYGSKGGGNIKKEKDKLIQAKKMSRKNQFPDFVEHYFTENKHNGSIQANLFADYFPPAKAPKIKTKKKKIITNQSLTVPSRDPVEEAKEYITSYKLYGSYQQNGTRAVFLSKNKLVLVAKIGDRINGKYLINDINNQQIMIKALDINKTFHLDLREFKNE